MVQFVGQASVLMLSLISIGKESLLVELKYLNIVIESAVLCQKQFLQ